MGKEDKRKLTTKERLRSIVEYLRSLIDQGSEHEVLDLLAEIDGGEFVATNTYAETDAGDDSVDEANEEEDEILDLGGLWQQSEEHNRREAFLKRPEDDQETEIYTEIIKGIRTDKENVLPEESILNWKVISGENSEASNNQNLSALRSVAQFILDDPLIISEIDLDNLSHVDLIEKISQLSQVQLTEADIYQPWLVDQVFLFSDQVKTKPVNLFDFLKQFKRESLSRIYLGGIMRQATQAIDEHMPTVSTQQKATASLLTEPGFTTGTIDMVFNEVEEIEFVIKMRPACDSYSEVITDNDQALAKGMMVGSREPVSIIFKERFAQYMDVGLYDMLTIAHEKFHIKFYEIVGSEKLAGQSAEQKQENKNTLAGALHEGFALFCEFELVKKMIEKALETGDQAMVSQLGFYLDQRRAEVGEINEYYQDGLKIVEGIMNGKDSSQVVEIASSIDWQRAYQLAVNSGEYITALDDPQQLLLHQEQQGGGLGSEEKTAPLLFTEASSKTQVLSLVDYENPPVSSEVLASDIYDQIVGMMQQASYTIDRRKHMTEIYFPEGMGSFGEETNPEGILLLETPFDSELIDLVFEICKENQLFVEHSQSINGVSIRIHCNSIDSSKIMKNQESFDETIHVGQSEYAIVDPIKSVYKVETNGLGPCMPLVIQNKKTGVLIFGHIDDQWGVMQLANEAIRQGVVNYDDEVLAVFPSRKMDADSKIAQCFGDGLEMMIVEDGMDFSWDGRVREYKHRSSLLTKDQKTTDFLRYKMDMGIHSCSKVFDNR